MTKYIVSANLCDGQDYVAHWDGGEFDNIDDAYNRWNEWWPPRSEVIAALRTGVKEFGDDPEEYGLQIGLWDDDGNEYEFLSEGFGEKDLEG